MVSKRGDWKGQKALPGLLLLCSLGIGLGFPTIGNSFEGEDALLRLVKGDITSPTVPAVAMKAPESSQGPLTHVVAQGETLYGIARAYRMHVDDLRAINQLGPNALIKPGQTLLVSATPQRAQEMKNLKKEPAGPLGSRTSFPSRGAVLTSMQIPLEGPLTSPFGPRKNAFHHGIDIAGDKGEIIRATQDGKVTFTGWKPVYGKTVIVEHDHGVRTLYAHASEILVREGDEVEKGQGIARVGATGVATGPHLHLEVHVELVPVNPITYFRHIGM